MGRRMIGLPSQSKLIAFLPSVLGSLIHFQLSVLVGPRANAIFQHWFDTGEPASGADTVIQSVNNILSFPIPALFFAKHPAYGLAPGWWVATILNSVLWGLVIYACYAIPMRLLGNTSKSEAAKQNLN